MTTKKLVSEVLGKVIIDTTQPEKALPGINDLISQLQARLKAATLEAARFGKSMGGSPDDAQKLTQLKTQIKTVQVALKELNTISKAVQVVHPGDTEALKKLHLEINRVVATLEGYDKRAAVKKGVFGLDPTSIKEGEANLRGLKRAAQETRAELALMGDTKGLKNLEETIKKNKALLKSQVEDLRRQKMQDDQDLFQNQELGKQQKKLEMDHVAALRMNAARDKKLAEQKTKWYADQALFENMELGKRQKSLERAHIQALQSDAIFNKRLADQKAKWHSDQALFENMELGKKQRRMEQEHLTALRMNAAFDKRHSEDAKQDRIRQASSRRLELVGGMGGASLLGVQASLMANYSLLHGVTGGMVQGIRTAVDLEAAFKNIQAVTVTTSKEMQGLEKQIKDVAAASKFNSIEVANAALILGQAGLNAKQTGDALKAVSTLAVASGSSMAEAVDLVTSVIGVFDKKASEAIDVTNKITAAANSSKINVEKMTLAFQYAGNTSSQMGISFEETTAALAAMSNAGIKSGSTMGTGLRAFLTETQKPTEEFIKIITSLGLSMTDLDFKAHGLLGVARKLRDAGFIASDAIKSFDVRSAAAFNAMVANPDDLERQYKLLLDTNAGLAAEAVQMDSLQSQSQRLTTSLGNLVATGFEPLSKVLKVVFGGMATVVQGMSEWDTVMGVLGTTLGVVTVAAVVKYTASLALGAAATLGLTKATVASVSAMSAGSVATALATKAKLAFSAATAGATASTFTLAGAVRMLSGMSIFGALGLAAAGATAAFVAFNYAMDSSKRHTDELRAALDQSKGVYQEHVGVIESLDAKIKELNHKSDSLAGTQKDVELMAVALTAQFGKEGFASDKLADSFAKQANQLRKLRDLKEQSAKQSLELARLDAKAMTEDQEKQLSGDLANVRQRGTVVQGIDRAMANGDIKHLNQAQVSILAEMRDALQRNDPNNPGPLNSATEIFRILARKTSEEKTLGVFSSKSNFYNEAADQLNVANMSASNVRQARAEQKELDIKAIEISANEQFAKAEIFGGMTFNQAMAEVKSVGIEQDLIAGGAARGSDGKTDPIKLHTLAMEETRKALSKLQGMEAAVEDQRINTTDEGELERLRKARTEIHARMEDVKVTMGRLTEQTQPIADRLEEARKSSAKGSEQQKNKEASAERIMANALAEAMHKHRGIIDPKVQKQMIDADVAGATQRSTNVRRAGPTTQIRQFRLAEEIANREAAMAQRDANLAGSEDAARMYMEMGLKARAKAREASMAQLQAKLKEDSEVGGSRAGLSQQERQLEIRNLTEAEDQKDREFIQKFTGFANVAQAQVQKVRAATNEIRQDLLDLQNFNTQKQFDNGERARELQERVDVNTQLGDPRGENLLLERQLKKELVNVDKQFLVAKEAELRLEDRIIEGEEAQLALLEASLQATEKRVEQLQKLHDLGAGFMSGQEQQEFIAAKGRLDPERTEVRNQRALVAGARRQRVDTQRQLYDTRGRIRQNLVPEIQEVNLQNLGGAMDDVWAKWQNMSTNMDVVRTMREGLGSQFSTMTSELGSVFMNITTGTKSVSRSFKDMAASVVESIAQVINQLLAMLIVKQIMGLASAAVGAFTGMGGAMSGSAISGPTGGTFGGGLDVFAPGAGLGGAAGMPTSMPLPFGATGGLMTDTGFMERAQFLAGGGPVFGGTPGRDSVPAMLMPGEYVVQKRVVDMVGTDFMHGLNAKANVIANSAPSKQSNSEGGNKLLNIWVVTPDQAKQQSTTPSDIVIAVADNIERGGSIKKLIQQINMRTVF